jgi:NCS1 family nucleobase:cation symporter-1
MIKVGLSWKLAIGACVLGNAIMGLVITINGRMGAIVGCPSFIKRLSELTWNSFILRSLFSHACHLAITLATLSSCPAASSPSSGSGKIV